jgi:hypothetical protein
VASQKNQFRATLTNWYHENGRALPWRQTRDPYAILVSEFMLQQTQVVAVLPYYNKWLRRFPDFSTLARASGNDVLHAWQGLGYYARARNLRFGQNNHRSTRWPFLWTIDQSAVARHWKIYRPGRQFRIRQSVQSSKRAACFARFQFTKQSVSRRS